MAASTESAPSAFATYSDTPATAGHDVPWSDLVRLHRAIVQRAEEGFWSLEDSNETQVRERWSPLDGFEPIGLDGPWPIDADSTIGVELRRQLDLGRVETLFLGGPCLKGSSTFGTRRTACWLPVLYREVRFTEGETGAMLVPVSDAWMLSPVVPQQLDRLQVRPDLEPDALGARIVQETREALTRAPGSPLDAAVIAAVRTVVPEFGEQSRDRDSLAVTNSPWVLFTPPTRVGIYNRNLMRDYDAMIRQLDAGGAGALGGLTLLRPPAVPVVERQAAVLPFVALNGAQEKAVAAMLAGRPCTVVSGPPGCGKSQVVVSLLLNAWAQGQSVLFASNNNKAVDVVWNRIREFERDQPIAVRAGAAGSNNVASALRRILQTAASHERLRSDGDPAAVLARRAVLGEDERGLEDVLEAGTPQQVVETLTAALDGYTSAARIDAEVSGRERVLRQRLSDLAARELAPEQSAAAATATRAWIDAVVALHAAVPGDSTERMRHADEARRLAGLAGDALNICLLPADALDDPATEQAAAALIDGLGAWAMEARALFNAATVRRLRDVSWDAAYTRWTSEEDAASAATAANALAARLTSAVEQGPVTVRVYDEAQHEYARRRAALGEVGWPDDVREPVADADALGRWLTSWAEFIAMPERTFDPRALFRRRKLRSALAVEEQALRGTLPLDVWRRVGPLDDNGRDRLADVVDRLRRSQDARARLTSATGARDAMTAALVDHAAVAGGHGVAAPAQPLPFAAWDGVADALRARAEQGRAAAAGWRDRNDRERLRAMARRLATTWGTLVQPTTALLAPWLNVDGRALAGALRTLAMEPACDAVAGHDEARPAGETLSDGDVAITDLAVAEVAEHLADGVLGRALDALGEACRLHGAMMAAVARRDAVPTEPDRIAQAWVARGADALVLEEAHREDRDAVLPHAWPDLATYDRRAMQIDEWRAEWLPFSTGEAPMVRERARIERMLAAGRLRDAANMLPQSSDADGVRTRVSQVLDDAATAWPVGELHERFAAFTPERLKSRLDGIRAQLTETALAEARRGWGERLGSDVAALQAVSRLQHTAGDDGQGDLAHHPKTFAQALRLAPVWITTAQATRAIPLAPHLFDLVVIDEASQCTLTNLLPIIYRARRLVVIGDPRQLPAITVVGGTEERALAEQFGVRDFVPEFGHDRRDLYTVTSNALPRSEADVVELDEHYRSDPLIIGFANRYVYQRQLKLRRPPSRANGTGVQPGMHVQKVVGRAQPGKSGTSWENAAEARAAVEHVQKVLAAGVRPGEIGVVTPFAAQKELIRSELKRAGISEAVQVDTAFGFQGGERSVIVFSAVVGPDIKRKGTVRWVGQPPNLLNVALTRAKDALYVIANTDFLAMQDGILRDLATYLRDLDALAQSHPANRALFALMMMDGWAPDVHPEINREKVSFALNASVGHRVAVIVRPQTHLEDAPSAEERSRHAQLAASGYRVVEAIARDVLETPAVVMQRLRDAMRA